MFTMDSVKLLRKELERALEQVQKDLDITIDIGKISFTGSSATMTMKCLQGSPEESQKAEFEKHCETFGFRPTDYKRMVQINKIYYQLIGFAPSARKYKFTLKNSLTGEIIRTNRASVNFID